MRFKTYSEAHKQAQVNANLTRKPWIVFIDTSGAFNIEQIDSHRSTPITRMRAIVTVDPTEALT